MISDFHPSDDDLAAHVETPDPRIDAHLARCSDCCERLAHEREIAELLAERDVWDGALSLELEMPVSLAHRESDACMQAERETAAELLEPALRSMDAFREANIECNGRLHSAAVVHVLTSAANSLRRNQLQFALVVATAAANIADKLRHDEISRLSVGTAWLERAIAAYLLGKYREAEQLSTAPNGLIALTTARPDGIGRTSGLLVQTFTSKRNGWMRPRILRVWQPMLTRRMAIAADNSAR